MIILKARPTEAQAEAGNYKMKRRSFRGLSISVENPAGSVREGADRGGKKWRTKMAFDYGYIRLTKGVDGDHVDCYVGPDEDAPNVYVVTQMAVPDFKKVDEQKAMIGFKTKQAAVRAYLAHYDDKRFLGPVTTMPFGEFKDKVLATNDRPGMVKSAPLVVFFKSYVRAYRRRGKDGKVISVGSYHNSVVPEPAPLRGRGKDTLTGDLFGAQPGDGKKQDEETPDHERGEDGRRSALAMLPKQASFRDGKGIARGKVAVEIDGDVVSNYHEKPEDAAKEAMKFMAQNSEWEAKSKAEESAIRELRSRLVGGGLAGDNDLKLLGLRPMTSGMKWFIPAAARLFGMSPREIRPIVSDMIVNGKTESGADVEFVPPKKALRAIADHVRAGGTSALTVTAPTDELIDEHRRLVRVLESPSHADDKAEAAKQREELRGYEGRPAGGGDANAHYRVKSVGDVRDLSDIERVIVDLIDLFGGASAKAIIADARRSGHSERKARKAISGLSKRGVIEREGA